MISPAPKPRPMLFGKVQSVWLPNPASVTASPTQLVQSAPRQPQSQPQPLQPSPQPPVIEDKAASDAFDAELLQALPIAIDEVTTLSNPPAYAPTSAKETNQQTITAEKPQVDVVGSVQFVEHEPQYEIGELPPEVDAYLEQVEMHHDQIPQEVVVADTVTIQPQSAYLAQPVIVLPITAAEEKAGAHKSTTSSIRWLVEWSRKIMRIFSGKVVYRTEMA